MKAKVLNYSTSKNQNGTIGHLNLHPEGKTFVVTQSFYNNKIEQALRSKSIWVNAVERQLDIPQEERTPSASQIRNFFELVEGKTSAQAISATNKKLEARLLSFVGKTINIYRTENVVGGRTYVNYQPYEPVIADDDDTTTEEDFE
jgi:hypothetical protein